MILITLIMITSGKHSIVLGKNHGRRQYPGGKERVCTQYIVVNTRIPRQVSCVLSHKYYITPNHSILVSSKTKVRTFILCAFKPLATKLQCLWVSPTTSWLLQTDSVIKIFEPFVTARFGMTGHRTVLISHTNMPNCVVPMKYYHQSKSNEIAILE